MNHHVGFRREILAQSSFSHPNIVPILAICLNPLSAAMEYCALGDLNRYLLKPSSPYSWKLAIKIAKDIAAAIEYMQSFTPPWAHLDLKSPNILLKSSSPQDPVCALLTDFGTSQPVTELFTMRYVDNPTWLAPEILAGVPYNEKARDHSQT